MPVIPSYFQGKMPAISRPIQQHKFKIPKARIHLNDLAHEGSSIFLSNIKGNEDIEAQIQNVLNLLYTPDDTIPGTRSVTLVLRSMDGVAYTSGIDLDEDHKEIHFSLDYITGIKDGHRHEMLGVICHELVHCFQWSAQGCPGGLIEGVADWVRLRANLGAKHWKEKPGDDWSSGYQDTGYFLDYLERRFGHGTVRKINGCLREGKYDEKTLFGQCCDGHRVKDLWKDYKEEVKNRKGLFGKDDLDAPKPIPTHAVQRKQDIL